MSDNVAAPRPENKSRFWGEVPKDWQLVKGSDVYDVNPSYDPDTSENTYIEMDALDTELPTPRYFGTRDARDYSGKRFTKGDTLFARITPCTENGKAALVPEMNSRVGIGSTEYAVLSPYRDKTHPHFLYYIAKSHPLHNYAISRMRGSTGRQRVPFEVFRKEIDIPLPPLKEQRKIASVLYNIDRMIQKEKITISCLERLQEGVREEVIREGFGDTETRDIRLSAVKTHAPSHWDVETIETVTDTITDGAHLTPNRSKNGYLLLSARNVKNGRLDLSEVDHIPESEYKRLRQKCDPEKDDLLVSCSGTVGRACKVPPDMEFALVRSAALLKLNSKIDPDYCEHVFRSRGVQKQVIGYQTQSAQPNLFQGQIASIEIPLPPIEEQVKIAEILDNLDELRFHEEAYMNQLQTEKRGLMQDLLSGEVRTHDKDIDVLPEVKQHG